MKCDGDDVGSEENEVEKSQPLPDEQRTEDDPESSWL